MRSIAVLALILAGFAVAGYYSYLLLEEDLKEWQRVEVLFDGVGGLEEDDAIFVQGVRLGRVAEIRLFEDRQMVVLEIDPSLTLREGASVSVESQNALGAVAVVVEPGPLDADPLPAGTRLEGKVAGGGISFDSSPAARQATNRTLEEAVHTTRDMQAPDSGVVGTLLFDSDGARALDDALTQQASDWEDLDQSLARIAGGGGAGRFMVNTDVLLSVQETIRAFAVTFRGWRDNLNQVERGDGVGGRVLADPAAAADWTALTRRIREFFGATRRGEGTLGGLTDPGEEPHDALLSGLDSARTTTRQALDGDGILGVLSHPSYSDGVRRPIRAINSGVQTLHESPLLSRDPEVPKAIRDAVADFDDGMLNFQRALQGLRRNLGARRTYQGVVFAVF